MAARISEVVVNLMSLAALVALERVANLEVEEINLPRACRYESRRM